MTNRDWTIVPQAVVQPILGSGCTYQLQRPDWPPWARLGEQFARIFIYALRPGETIPSVETTGEHVARLLAERYDAKDAEPYNYNWYAIVQSSNGSFYQSGPCRDIDFGHHLGQPVSLASIGLSQ